MQISHIKYLLFVIITVDSYGFHSNEFVTGADYGTVLDVAEKSFGCTTYVRLAKKAGLDKTLFNGKGKTTLGQ